MKKVIGIAAATCAGILALGYWFFVSQGKLIEEPAQSSLGLQGDKPLSVVSSVRMGETQDDATQANNGTIAKGFEKTAREMQGSKADLRTVKQYLKESGIEKEFYELDEMLDAQISALVEDSELNDQDKEKIARIFKDHINGEDLLLAYEKEMEKQFTAEEIQELNKILRDPIVQKVYDSVRDSDPKQAQAQYQEFISDLRANPPSPARRETVTKLVQASNNGAFMADVTMIMAENLGKYLAPLEAPPNPEEIKAFRQQIAQQADANIYDAMLFQARILSDDELKTFAARKTSAVSVKEEAIRKNVSKKTFSELFGHIGQSFKEK